MASGLNLLPPPPVKTWFDPGVVQCISASTGEVRVKFFDLKQQAVELKRDNKSVERVILEQRTLQEKYCKVEASCVADTVAENDHLVYGETFAVCLERGGK